jgi:hypothetical protein
LVLGLACAGAVCAAAHAAVPHEGNYTTKQMAGIALGYLMSDEARTCHATVDAADKLIGKLMEHYGFDKDDIEGDSPFGKRYVEKGRKIAHADSHDQTFCQDVDFEIQEDSVELLPH